VHTLASGMLSPESDNPNSGTELWSSSPIGSRTVSAAVALQEAFNQNPTVTFDLVVSCVVETEEPSSKNDAINVTLGTTRCSLKKSPRNNTYWCQVPQKMETGVTNMWNVTPPGVQ